MKERGARWQWWLSSANALALVGVYIASETATPRWWPGMLIAYLPPLLWLIPTVLIAVLVPLARIANLFLLGVWIVLIGGLQFRSAERPEQPIRIMTFNVQHGRKGLANVARLVGSENPDVFCLQEADSQVESWLRRDFPDHAFYRADSVAILSRNRPRSLSALPLPFANNRPLIRAEFEGFAVFVVHMDAAHVDDLLVSRPGELPSHLRAVGDRQAAQAAAVCERLETERLPFVLAGDFNGPPAGARYRSLRRFTRDAFREAGRGFGYTVPATFPLMRIDWILPSRQWEVADCFVPTGVASDHRAVVADLTPPRR